MRRFLAFLCAGLLFSCLSVVSTAEPFTQLEEFYFGVTGHPHHYEAYPERQLPEQIRLAAQLGSDLYRINSVPVNRNDFAYLDRVLALCSSYDMDMMLVLDSFPGETEQEIYENGKAIAAHFGQRLAFVQAGNELDNQCIQSAMVDGSSIGHFETHQYDEVMPKLKALLKGLQEGSSGTKTVVNIAYRHYGFLQRLVNDGIEFDVIGWDWYSNMGDYTHVFPTLLSFEKPVMICETNIWEGMGKDHTEERTRYLVDFMNYVYGYNSSLPLGFLVYELMDEPAFGDGSNVEAHFGLVDCRRDGTIIAPKQAYYDIQKLWTERNDELTLGDLDGNKIIDAKDALMVLKAAVGKLELTNSQKIACELNGDSTVNAKDALLILRYAVKKIDQFPIESTT